MRLLETDFHTVLPLFRKLDFVITSRDVLHSWRVPGCNVKNDVNTGKLTCVSSSIGVCGIYYGNCREIFGANHSFMPVVVEVVPLSLFCS